ncbi:MULTISPECIES: GNAT family N-acetyltransferase [Stenotrophomonas]|nr:MULTISPECIES: GNAT family N-acetyltransferase [Stenotrophomonas]MBH1408043.1 GNAT family N-acetyltransferase [Stenotrophomonas maltophilia]MBH1744353.1 GNAT family N-acetyltransferase [Stenotrophomonas maltophilia]MBH1863663.1 GNAT family N-acetyltransferase [Stenotrophomonas maltophilia]MDH1387642.1 GNAT family N-acetyltransferase [Stenotrophomonas sp. GD03701]MDH1393309.1 GNAT family N-acetyltransferase [Stenotrophomonas sp. GD03702]
MKTHTRVASAEDLEQVAMLFDKYRQFYAQPADLPLARQFMHARLSEGDSLVLVAEADGDRLVGFTQLYPLFDSISARPSFVLYDLYVDRPARRTGVARTLMINAVEEARRRGAARIELQTAKDNAAAQALYAGLGWQRDEDFFIFAIHP